MRRRTFLGAGFAGAVMTVLGCGGGADNDAAPLPAADADGFVRDRPLPQFLTLPNEASEANVFLGSLSAAPGDVNLIPGKATQMLLYNESIPGPLIELREGQRVRIELDNALPHE